MYEYVCDRVYVMCVCEYVCHECVSVCVCWGEKLADNKHLQHFLVGKGAEELVMCEEDADFSLLFITLERYAII